MPSNKEPIFPQDFGSVSVNFTDLQVYDFGSGSVRDIYSVKKNLIVIASELAY